MIEHCHIAVGCQCSVPIVRSQVIPIEMGPLYHMVSLENEVNPTPFSIVRSSQVDDNESTCLFGGVCLCFIGVSVRNCSQD